jgi:hypothetical protein
MLTIRSSLHTPLRSLAVAAHIPACVIRCRAGKRWRLHGWSCSGSILLGQLVLETASVPRLSAAALQDTLMTVEFRT